uniref:Sodium/potassium-transporting ATPase subunit gamma isoform X1 n=1 Tax=Callorhinus ursinus TaxID=34884 RepID=A0A3Q7QVC0_CALUR|nr:sodium/potassium-transporting ATPase subunit gamma isoform X1 [Callorhinus ursinus]
MKSTFIRTFFGQAFYPHHLNSYKNHERWQPQGRCGPILLRLRDCPQRGPDLCCPGLRHGAHYHPQQKTPLWGQKEAPASQ